MRSIQPLKHKIYFALVRSLERSAPHFTLLGLLGFIGFPIYYFVWQYIFPQPYENLPLRLVGSFLCLLMLLHKHWPRSARPYFPVFWYFTMMYSVPFFFNFMLLKNNMSIVWLMSTLAGLFILILVVDWLWVAGLYIAGAAAAWFAYIATSPDGAHLLYAYTQYMFIYIFIGIVGALFIYNTARLQKEKLDGMASISSNVAHELRTPLLGIKSGVTGLKRYLPILFSTYSLAKDSGLEVPTIRTAHLKNLLPALESMEAETNYANTIIDMLLMNVGRQPIEATEFATVSMADCVEDALKRYPFNSPEDRAKIFWNPENDFKFSGSQILMVHILFNLLKNALHFIVKAEKGDIYIWMGHDKNYNHLHFKDTGQGISSEVLPRLFTRFFTTTLTGTGIGLSFCKLVMEGFGGNIQCFSQERVFTEFVLSFPKVSPQK